MNYKYFPHTDADIQHMLDRIGIKSMDDLYADVPESVIVKEYNLPSALSEIEIREFCKELGNKNQQLTIFAGAGAYDHYAPAVISQLISRGEFLTAYTPYQPEISQGTLQVIYEYQTMISRLTGMDIANASMYDGGSACAEAVLMAHRIARGKKNKALISNKLNPEYIEVIKTYAWAQGIEIEWFEELPESTSEYFCVLMQYPDYFGEIPEIKKQETTLIVCANLSALSILKPPTDADIVVGDIQPLGLPMNFGGPHAGYMACKEAYMRQLPGRLVGRTFDADGQQAFTLTIQTREQHIKREKATSNICSNQSLMALCATLYLSLLGEKGFKQTGILSANLAHALSRMLNGKGIKTLNKNFFNEFVIETDSSDKFLAKLKDQNILGGIRLDDRHILVCTTEMNTEEEIVNYIEAV